MKKVPSKKELATVLLLGLGMLSFGLLFIWIPVIGWPFLFFGTVCILLFLFTVITMKVLK